MRIIRYLKFEHVEYFGCRLILELLFHFKCLCYNGLIADIRHFDSSHSIFSLSFYICWAILVDTIIVVCL